MNNNSQKYNTDLYIGEIPTMLEKYNMLTSWHLETLQEMFRDIAFYSHANFTSYYEAALVVHPDLMLHNSDVYMSSLINSLSLQGKQNIFVFCGYG